MRLIEDMAKALVVNKDGVSVTEKQERGLHIYELHVDENECGLVIGKNGRTANAMREVLKIKGYKEDKKIVLDIAVK